MFKCRNDFGRAPATLLLVSVALGACGDGQSVRGEGDVRVLLSAEETIAEGLAVGSGEEDTRDYAVSYSKFLAVVGGVAFGKELGKSDYSSSDAFVVDMQQVGEQGVELTRFDAVPAGQYDALGFATPAASGEDGVLAGASAEDAAAMRAAGHTFWIEGEVARPEADGGPVRFRLQLAAPTTYTGCELDGQPGFAVKDGGTSTVTINLHGDHLWFTSFTVGSEAGFERRSAWMTRVTDVAGDGVIDADDLAAASAADVLYDYDLSGNPGGSDQPIDSALDFVRQQLSTLGHYKLEGECQPAI
jgi:hypothetical protein